jgi:hypothetical protein
MDKLTPQDAPCDVVRIYVSRTGRERQYPSRSWVTAPESISSGGETFYFQKQITVDLQAAA